MRNPPTCSYWRMTIVLAILLCTVPLFAQADAPRFVSPTATTRARLPELVQQLKSTDSTVRLTAVNALCYLDDDRAGEGLLAALNDGNAIIRESAARGLLRLDDARFITPLFAALRGGPEDLRKMLAYGLPLYLRDPQAVAPLLVESQAADAFSRQLAAQMLGNCHQPLAADRLATMMAKDDAADVRQAALLALGRLGDARALPGLDALLASAKSTERAQAATALGRIHERSATAKLLPLLADGDPAVRLAVIDVLGELADPAATEALIAHLDTSDGKERQHLIQALAAIDLPALPSLATAAKTNPSPLIRLRALVIMTQINDSSAADTFLAALKDPNLCVCNAAITGLAQWKDKRAVSPLIALLRKTAKGVPDQEAEYQRRLEDRGNVHDMEREQHYPDGPPVDIITVRLSAIRALGKMQDPQTIPVLLPLALAGESRINIAASSALPRGKALTQAVLPRLTSGTTEQRIHALRLLPFRCDPMALPVLRQIIWTSSDPVLRGKAVDALAFMGDEHARKLLISLLKDHDRDVRNSAINALGYYPSPDTARVLINDLKAHQDNYSVYWLTIALQQAGNVDAVPVLATLLSTCDINRYADVVKTLRLLGGEASAPTIIASLQQRDFTHYGSQRWLAFKELAQLSGPKVISALAAESRNGDSFTREVCISRLETLADPTTADALLYALSDQSDTVRRAAAHGLGRMRAKAACDALLSVLQDDAPVSEMAAEAFGMMPDARALPILLRYARHWGGAAIDALAAYDSPQIRQELREIAQGAAAGWNRAAAMRVLLQLHDDASLPIFRKALQERDPLVKGWAAVALAHMSTDDVRPQLRQVERYCAGYLSPNVVNDNLAQLDNEIHDALGDPAIHNRHYLR